MDYTYSYGTGSTSTTPSIDGPELMALLGSFSLVFAVIGVLMIISMWRLFVKAGKPGWAAIVPIYNMIVMLEIVGRPMWWIVLYFIPIASTVAQIMVTLDLAKAYGKDTTFGVLMIFFPIPMYQILAFSKHTQYMGPVAHEQAQYGTPPVAFVTPQPVAAASASDFQPTTPVADAAPDVPVAPLTEQPSVPEEQPPVMPNQPQQ